MGTVIYSASPLETMFSFFMTPALLVGLAVVGMLTAVLRKNQSTAIRIGLGLVSVFLMLVGFGTGLIAYRSLSSGAVTVAARVNDKHIRQVSCGQDGDSTCTRYILETTSGDTNYDFFVTSQAYDPVQPGTCYQVSFYRSKSPLNATADTAAYQSIGAISRIEVADPAACP